MVKTKPIIWIIALLTLILPVFGALSDSNSNLHGYFMFEETATPYNNEITSVPNATGVNTPQRITGIIDFGQNMSKGSSESINWEHGGHSDSFTFNIWANYSSGEDAEISQWDDGQAWGFGANQLDWYINFVTGDVYFAETGGTTAFCTGAACDDNQWHMYTVIYYSGNNTIITLYDGSFVATTNRAVANTVEEINIESGPNNDDLSVDEMALWNTTLSGADITELYNAGAGFQYPFSVASSTDYFTITAIDAWNSSSILNFSADIDGTQYYCNSTGHINTTILSNDTLPRNITIFNMTSYYNRTYPNHIVNTSGNLEAQVQTTDSIYLTIIARNYLNTTNLTDVSITVNHTTTQNNNPFQDDLSNYINASETWRMVTVTIVDNTYLHRNYSAELNVSSGTRTLFAVMEGNQLVLNFTQNGNPISTTGFISDINKSYNFTNTTLVIVQQSLEEGDVMIRLNPIGNWTQFYEYENDYETHVNENLEVLATRDWFVYFRVLDDSNSPIEDATIRAFYSIPTANNGSEVPMRLFGQRLTDEDGYTYFWTDTSSATYYLITKDGYAPADDLRTAADENRPRTDPIIIRLRESENVVRNNTWVYTDNYFINHTHGIPGFIIAMNKEIVEITSSWRESQGYPRIVLTGNSLDTYSFNATCGTSTEDFFPCTQNNSNISIYVDNVLFESKYVTYDDSKLWDSPTGIEFNGIERAILNPILGIGLIILAAMAGLVFKGESVSPTTWRIGVMGLALITPNFWWVMGVILAGYAMEAVRKVISE